MVHQCPSGTFPYIILPGDSFSVLARRYNTSVEAIRAANPGIDPNNLQVGQRICMPALEPHAPCPRGSKIYLAQAGESFYSIAEKFNVPFDVLLSANPGLDLANLQIGQAICIPPLPACPDNSIPYAINPGDTYYTLSMFTGVSINDLILANPGVDPNNLQVGQVICLPYRPVPTPD